MKKRSFLLHSLVFVLLLLFGATVTMAQFNYVSKTQDVNTTVNKTRTYDDVYLGFLIWEPFIPGQDCKFMMAKKGKAMGSDGMQFRKTTKDRYMTSHYFYPPADERDPYYSEIILFIPSVREVQGIKCDVAIVVKKPGTTTTYYADKVAKAPEWTSKSYGKTKQYMQQDSEKRNKALNEVKKEIKKDPGSLTAITKNTSNSKVKQPPQNGYGSYTDTTGTVYTGNWVNGRLNGKATSKKFNGDVYEGEWKDDKMNGRGKYTWKENGSWYEGNWKDQNRSGTGTMNFSNGDVYSGEWSNDRIHGKGKYTWKASGIWYDGNWVDGRIEGFGKQIYANGNVYSGNWKKNWRDGDGTLTYKNGDVYTGQWKDNNRHGHGTYTYINGDKYSGYWVNDQLNGKVTLNTIDGGIVEYEYSNGEKLSEKVTKEDDKNFEGIGIAYNYDKGKDQYIIITVGDRTPASAAGLKVNDVLISANGIIFKGKSTIEVANLIKGAAGSTVKLGISRTGKQLEISVKRQKIETRDFLKSN